MAKRACTQLPEVNTVKWTSQSAYLLSDIPGTMVSICHCTSVTQRYLHMTNIIWSIVHAATVVYVHVYIYMCMRMCAYMCRCVGVYVCVYVRLSTWLLLIVYLAANVLTTERSRPGPLSTAASAEDTGDCDYEEGAEQHFRDEDPGPSHLLDHVYVDLGDEDAGHAAS